jgi:predicted dehydrogenase
VEVVGGYDPRGGAVPRTDHDVQRFGSLADLIAAADVVVVATPTATHAEVCRAVLRAPRPPALLLVEKPLATTISDVLGLFADAEAAQCELEVLYHVSYSPEVVWGREVCPAVGATEGGVIEVESYFSDLVRPGEVSGFREVYGSSWVDLGINALSVLSGFVHVDALKLEGADHEAGLFRGLLTFDAGGRMGKGVITTAWQRDEKWTVLRFHSGAMLRLDHQRRTGEFSGPLISGPSKRLVFVADPAVPRLLSHYIPMFTEMLIERRRRVLPSEDSALHRLLLEAG